MCILAYKSSIIFANNPPFFAAFAWVISNKGSLWSIEINFFSRIFILALDSGSLVACFCIHQGGVCMCVRVCVCVCVCNLGGGVDYSDYSPRTPDDCIILLCQSRPWHSSLKAPFWGAGGGGRGSGRLITSMEEQQRDEEWELKLESKNRARFHHQSLFVWRQSMYMLMQICCCCMNWLLIGIHA